MLAALEFPPPDQSYTFIPRFAQTITALKAHPQVLCHGILEMDSIPSETSSAQSLLSSFIWAFLSSEITPELLTKFWLQHSKHFSDLNPDVFLNSSHKPKPTRQLQAETEQGSPSQY